MTSPAHATAAPIRVVGSLCIAAMVALSFGCISSAYAFHSAMLFPDEGAVGGGGGLLYNGSPRHKGYTCAACHLGAPGVATLALTSDPAALNAEGTYEPGQLYTLGVNLVGESRGLQAKANYNTFGIEAIDAQQAPAGSFENFVAGGMVSTIDKDALFARGLDGVAATSWSFDWRAPAAGAGPIRFYLAGVDGDGAGSSDVALTNPGGDDVMVVQLQVFESGQPSLDDEPLESGCSAGRSASGGLAELLLVWAAILLCRFAATPLRPGKAAPARR